MSNTYKEKFQELYIRKKNAAYSFFYERNVVVGGINYKYLICHVDLEILKCALDIAKVKSNYTMAYNQAGIPRSMVIKVQKCCQGVLAEMFVHILLMERYKLDTERFDLERPDFRYYPNEYDINILLNGKAYEVEVRSSNIHHKDIGQFIKNDVIIGPYTNSIKKREELASFFFRPIYMPEFKPFEESHGQYRFSRELFDGGSLLAITGVATKDEMENNFHYKSLGQKGTTYRTVDAMTAGDIDEMDRKFEDFIRSKS